MAAARYWRLVGIETYAGGDLELSALHLYAGDARVDGAATLTSSSAPIAGALAGLQDSDTATVCRFAGAAVRSGGFALVWDFGAGSTADITGLRPGGGGGSASFIASCILQSSTDGSTWVFEKEFGRYPWPGVLAMNAVPSPDGDDAYPNVSLLLHGDDSFADSSSAPKTLTVANGTPTFSTSIKKFGSAAMDFSRTGAMTIPSGMDFGTGDFTVETWIYWVTAVGTAEWGAFQLSTPSSYVQNQQNIVVLCGAGNVYSFYTGHDYSQSSKVITTGTWQQLEINRSGGRLRAFVDGVQILDVANTFNFANPSGVIGGYYNSNFNGNVLLDDFRVTKGVARHTANFTPPIAPFPNNGGSAGGIVFEAPALHTRRGDIDIAASAPVPAHSTLSAPRLQMARDIEFGGPGTIYGTTKTKGTPNQPTHARVVLLHQRSKLPVRETWSDPVTGNFAFPGIDTTQQFLTLAEDAAGNFRPVAANLLTPEVLP